MKAPFPWFGGKSRAAHLVWAGFGDVANYVEPFAGSLAVLLGRPTEPGIETVNDLDCYLANFWRAVKWAPELVAEHADWPVNEADLHARHRDLVTRVEFRRRMKREARYFDAEIAGWWVWGLCQWIGSGWCASSKTAGKRPTLSKPGQGVHANQAFEPGFENTRPHLGSGSGVHRRERDLTRASEWEKRPRLDSSTGVTQDLAQQLPAISGLRGASGRGVHASGLLEKLPNITAGFGTGSGVHSSRAPLISWMQDLAARLRRVRVCCGDWKRILGRSSTESIGVTGVMLDPPYLASAGRDPSLYSAEDLTVANDVREWALENARNPKLRIALCGYEGEHEMPRSWECVAWKAVGGYAAAAGNTENARRERIWFSPSCAVVTQQRDMFDAMEEGHG